MLDARHLVKDFRLIRRQTGLQGFLRNLISPEYDTFRAVDDVSFHLGEADILGLLGPNGAGKSTILKLLTGVLQPTSGDIHFNGRALGSDRHSFALQIGAVFGQRSQLWWELPLRDSFALMRAIYEIPPGVFAASLADLVEALGLEQLLDIQVRQLSLGQRARAELCSALLHRPRVLFLDEPTLGLDIEARDAFHRVIRNANRRFGTAIILTTHDVSDIDALCERIAIVRAGKLAYLGSVQQAKATLAGTGILICHIQGGRDDIPNGKSVPTGLDFIRVGDRITMRFDRSKLTSEQAVNWLSNRHEILSCTSSEISTSDLLLEIYRTAVQVP